MKKRKQLFITSFSLTLVGVILMFSSYSIGSALVKQPSLTDDINIEVTTNYAMKLGTYTSTISIIGTFLLGAGILLAVFTVMLNVVLINVREKEL